jgi:hypothetical protein
MTNTCPTERGPDLAVVAVDGAAVDGDVVPDDLDDCDDEHPATASASAHPTTARRFPTGEACPRTAPGRNALLVPTVRHG